MTSLGLGLNRRWEHDSGAGSWWERGWGGTMSRAAQSAIAESE